MYNFGGHPIEYFVLYITFLNPIDLSQIIVLMQTDAAALMGYSGAAFERFFTETQGSLGRLGHAVSMDCNSTLDSFQEVSVGKIYNN
ncbi:MAG: hypothetical protein U5L96_02860 [Owenweeksia sp.]|nr:hypothetical protein [Owenweeksia sp.]